MPNYYYTARDKEGKPVNGQRSGQNIDEVANFLIKEGLIPLDISHKEVQKIQARKKHDIADFFAPRVTSEDLHMLCRQMYSLLRAGIPIATAVTRLAETTRNPTLASTLNEIVVNLNKGSSLHLAMGRFPKVFSPFFLNLIVVGENTGNLDDIFLRLAEYLELEVDITKKIKTALRYPVIVISAIIIALIIINIFVIPAFAKLYANMHGVLPLPTRILLATSNFILNYWYVLITSIFVIGFSVRHYINTPLGRLKWGKWQLKIPIIGWLVHRILLARFARLLALVLRAGIPAVDGIQLVGATTNNAYVSLKIHDVTDLVIRGNTLSSAIAKTQLFPSLIIQMITLGEESGAMERLLDEVADYYQREIDYDIVRLSDAIEPILLVVIGAMVLILALGIFLPTWNLATLIKQQ